MAETYTLYTYPADSILRNSMQPYNQLITIHMKTKFLLMSGMLAFFTGCFAQESNINRYNNVGEKEGYWIIESSTSRFECHYKNGKYHGLMKMFNGNGELFSLGFYEEGLETGVFYYFDKGKLSFLQKDFRHNITPILSKYNYPYHNICYHIGFHPNGVTSDEGHVLWSESSISDDAYDYGEWKYYDENGILIRTEYYK